MLLSSRGGEWTSWRHQCGVWYHGIGSVICKFRFVCALVSLKSTLKCVPHICKQRRWRLLWWGVVSSENKWICSLFNDAISVSRSVEWRCGKWMMNWKGFGRRRSWPNLRYFPGICLKNEKNHEKHKWGLPVSGPRFQPGTSRIRSRSVNQSNTTLGENKWRMGINWICLNLHGLRHTKLLARISLEVYRKCNKLIACQFVN
jgi:hypothetical protein